MATSDSTTAARFLIEAPGGEPAVINLPAHLLRPLERIAAAGPAGVRPDAIFRAQASALRSAGVPAVCADGAYRLGAVITRLSGGAA